MALTHLLLVAFAGISSGLKSTYANPTSSANQVQLVPVQTVQLVPVVQQELPNVATQADQQPQQQFFYLPVSNSPPQAQQYTVLNKVESPHQQPPAQTVQGGMQQGVLEQIPAYQSLPSYQADAIHHAIHSPPPAPAGATSAYVATLSYGPGYPAIVYNCYIPGRHPSPPSKADYLVNGSNGYQCAVHYQHSGNYHIVHLVSNSQNEQLNLPINTQEQ